jgi:hypothetical protein
MSCFAYVCIISSVIPGVRRQGVALSIGPNRLGFLLDGGDRIQSPKRRSR